MLAFGKNSLYEILPIAFFLYFPRTLLSRTFLFLSSFRFFCPSRLISKRRWAQILTLLSSWLVLIGAIISYHILMGNSLLAIIASVAFYCCNYPLPNGTTSGSGGDVDGLALSAVLSNSTGDNGGVDPSNTSIGPINARTVPLIVLALTFPLCCLPRMGMLVRIASFGVVFVVYVVVFVLVVSAERIAEVGWDVLSPSVDLYRPGFGKLAGLFAVSYFVQVNHYYWLSELCSLRYSYDFFVFVWFFVIV